MSKPIEIDLRRDLTKVREQLEAILPNMGKCRYSSPCAIGAMLPEDTRVAFDALSTHGVSVWGLIRRKLISLPDEQKDDATALQWAFDGRDRPRFLDTLARLEAKYLTGEVG